MRPCGHVDASTRTQLRPRRHRRVHTDQFFHLHASPPPVPPRSPYADRLLHLRGRSKKTKNKIIFFGSCLLEKRGKKCSVFGFQSQSPQDPQDPQDPRASQPKPQEEKGFFGLILLVTHPSCIPLLGGLIPKFLSLSFHSLQSLLTLMASRVGTL
jgi:hypothetical protein